MSDCRHERSRVPHHPGGRPGVAVCLGCGAERDYPNPAALKPEDWRVARVVAEDCDSDASAPAFVVRNEQRLSVDGESWPGCRGCGHVYAHREGCAFFVESSGATS